MDDATAGGTRRFAQRDFCQVTITCDDSSQVPQNNETRPGDAGTAFRTQYGKRLFAVVPENWEIADRERVQNPGKVPPKIARHRGSAADLVTRPETALLSIQGPAPGPPIVAGGVRQRPGLPLGLLRSDAQYSDRA